MDQEQNMQIAHTFDLCMAVYSITETNTLTSVFNIFLYIYLCIYFLTHKLTYLTRI